MNQIDLDKWNKEEKAIWEIVWFQRTSDDNLEAFSFGQSQFESEKEAQSAVLSIIRTAKQDPGEFFSDLKREASLCFQVSKDIYILTATTRASKFSLAEIGDDMEENNPEIRNGGGTSIVYLYFKVTVRLLEKICLLLAILLYHF